MRSVQRDPNKEDQHWITEQQLSIEKSSHTFFCTLQFTHNKLNVFLPVMIMKQCNDQNNRQFTQALYILKHKAEIHNSAIMLTLMESSLWSLLDSWKPPLQFASSDYVKSRTKNYSINNHTKQRKVGNSLRLTSWNQSIWHFCLINISNKSSSHH